MKRILTALLLLPLVISIILFGAKSLVEAVAGGVMCLAIWEWCTVIGLAKPFSKVLATAFIVGSGVLAKLFLPVMVSCSLALGWWAIGFIAIVFYPRGAAVWKNSWLALLVGLFLFIPSWQAIVFLHSIPNVGPSILLFACSLVWLADSVAYYAGKTWGKTKLLPAVSPGKTWVGVWAAIFITTLIAIPLLAIFLESSASRANGLSLAVLLADMVRPEFLLLLIKSALLVIATIVMGIIGDLVESLFKRVRGVKDSGNLLPGHGGILDRIDALLAALPVFAVGYATVFLNNN